MIDDALFGVVTQEPQERQLNGITVVRKLHRMDKTYGDFALSLRSSVVRRSLIMIEHYKL